MSSYTSSTAANSKETFIQALIDAGALSFGTFELKSKRVSPYFCNCGKLSSGRSVGIAGEALASAIKESFVQYDVLFGPAYKGIPFVTAAAIGLSTLFKDNAEFAYNRKEAKDHGEGGNLVGASLKGKRVFIVDDVITAGTAVKEAIQIIKEAGGIPVGVAVLLDREEKGTDSELSAVQQVEKEFGIPVASAIKCRDLFNFVHSNAEFQQHKDAMEKYRQQYGAVV